METAHHLDAPGNSWKKLQSLLSVVPTLLWHTYPLLIKHGNGRSCIHRFFSHIKTIKHPLIRDFPLLRIWLAEATPSSAVFFRVENSRSPEGRESDVRSEWCCGLPSQIEHHSSKGGAWTSVENGSQTPSYGHSIRKVMMNQQDRKEISEIPFGTLHFQTNSNVGQPVFRHFPFRFFSNIQLSIGLKDLETLFAAAARISWGHHTFCSTTRALVSSQTSVLPCLGRFVSLGTSESNGFLEKSRKTMDQCFLALLETKEHDGTCSFFSLLWEGLVQISSVLGVFKTGNWGGSFWDSQPLGTHSEQPKHCPGDPDGKVRWDGGCFRNWSNLSWANEIFSSWSLQKGPTEDGTWNYEKDLELCIGSLLVKICPKFLKIQWDPLWYIMVTC